MDFIGIDAGSTTTKGVLFHKGELSDHYLLATAGAPKQRMLEILEYFTKKYHLSRSEYAIVTTGYGRNLLDSDLSATEITCHGKGAEYLLPGVKQVIDVGGQDCKTILLNGKGGVLDFNMNDKCAAGTGRFVEVMMQTLGEQIEQLDSFVAGATPVKINSMCTVFAESEVIGLVAQGEERRDIALGVLHSIAKRISNQYSKLRAPQGSVLLFTGGLSKSHSFAEVLADALSAKVETSELSQYAGAIGAAKMGMKKLQF